MKNLKKQRGAEKQKEEPRQLPFTRGGSNPLTLDAKLHSIAVVLEIIGAFSEPFEQYKERSWIGKTALISSRMRALTSA